MMAEGNDRIDRATDVDLTVQPRQPDRSLGELLSDMTTDLSRLTRQELQLARVELREEARQAARVGIQGAAGGAIALVGAVIVAMAGSWLLDLWMPRALAFLIVGAALLVVAAVLVQRAKSEARAINPVPQQTKETLKEDIEWAKTQRS